MTLRDATDLYRINEVPDPTGQLADLFSELTDNSVLVAANPDYEAAARFLYESEGGDEWKRESILHRQLWLDMAKGSINAALHIGLSEEE